MNALNAWILRFANSFDFPAEIHLSRPNNIFCRRVQVYAMKYLFSTARAINDWNLIEAV